MRRNNEQNIPMTDSRKSFLLAAATSVALGLPISAAESTVAEPAAAQAAAPVAPRVTVPEQELLDLSRAKWRWMAERDVDRLSALFHGEAVFVHMGGTMSRQQELDVIRSGSIQYKDAQIQEASVRFVGATAIVLNRIRLVAVVGGNEVVNPFVVTEVYVKQGDAWTLASLSFTRLLR
ncbi:MAG: nuclear transport factor 2 family protein [Opitutaceae bacterium]|nr:nuclear transport factor 2 family protein [Opitutaceae bacterium]